MVCVERRRCRSAVKGTICDTRSEEGSFSITDGIASLSQKVMSSVDSYDLMHVGRTWQLATGVCSGKCCGVNPAMIISHLGENAHLTRGSGYGTLRRL